MRITKADVIHTAADIADKNGLSNVSLKVVAESLNIRTPSLYNHIDSLEALLREIAHNGMKTMNERMMQAAIGKIGDDAIQSVGQAYLNYMIEHPGIYETIQWATWHGTEETRKGTLMMANNIAYPRSCRSRSGALCLTTESASSSSTAVTF
jgi:AcrR family transcriptional regulator